MSQKARKSEGNGKKRDEHAMLYVCDFKSYLTKIMALFK